MIINSPRFHWLIRASFIFTIACPVFSKAQSGWRNSALNYIQKHLAKPDGGYGWEDQPDSHLTPSFAVVGILHDLSKLPANTASLVNFVKTHHPQRGKNIEAGPSGTEERDVVYQQMQSLVWLNADISFFKNEVIAWKPQNNKVSNFEEHGYPVFLQEMMTPVCRSLLHVSLDDVSAHFTGYLRSRRRENGSFNNAPSTDGGDGNIINTYWGIYGWQQVIKNDEKKQLTIDWVKACQVKSGGFTHQPEPVTGANDEVAYTWAAVKALQLLSAEPADKAACIGYIISLHNDDGGFANKPGLPSNPMATFYAIDALKALNAFAILDKTHFPVHPHKKAADLSGLKIFTVQFEASGVGSPYEAVMLAESLHINLWGCKNSTAIWRSTAQKIADERKVPVIFFQSDEAYGKTVTVAGQGTFSHVMDYIAPASANKKLNLDGSSWQRYQQTFIDPLIKDTGALILQVTNNEPLGRMILDESLKSGGFAAISTIHFGQNFSFWLPWLHQYRYQFPFIALQDAHGTESWWWQNELTGYRTLFLGKTGSYEDLVKALKNNWVVAVRHDSISDYKTRLLGGAEGVQSLARSREDKWKWWKKGTSELLQPWAAITVVTNKDTFEVARPEIGVNVRIRCWWNSVRQALKNPAVMLVSLKIDNKEVVPEYIEKKDGKGALTDSYYLHSIQHPAEGKHLIEATLKNTKTGSIKKVSEVFFYNSAGGNSK
ncbi:MAG: prenyltransferase/squalene oxidase repeat-containing protein [Segetibacter sp.]